MLTLFSNIGKFMHGNSSDDELQLMKRVQAGDKNALEELYDQYKSLLFGMILSIVNKRKEAEDLLQEIFVQIWNEADTFNEDGTNVYSWLVTVTRNKAINRIRSKGDQSQQGAPASNPESLVTLQACMHDPLETAISSDRAELVNNALQKMPDEQSQIIKLAYYRGMTQPEIAEHLDLPLETVKTETRQGMSELKRILEESIASDG